jgi:hypothetical protein
MADTPEARRARVPLSMRPRSTPNAELSAQKRDEWRYEEGVYDRPEVKAVPLRGYSKGGAVHKFGSPKITAPCKDSKTIKCY